MADSEGNGGYGLDKIPSNVGAARRAQAGITLIAGQYPDPWTGPQLSEMPFMSLADELIKKAEEEAKNEEPKKKPPPLTLPPWFGEDQ